MQSPITIERNRDGSYSASCYIIDSVGLYLAHQQYYGYTKKEIPRLFRQWLQNNNLQRAKI
jgi:hypothetical protein